MAIRFQREITTTVDVGDPVDYAAAAETNLKAILTERFKHRCHSGAFVLSVDGVVSRSAAVCKSFNNSGGVAVDVTFRATCVALQPGTIVLTTIKRMETLCVGSSMLDGTDDRAVADGDDRRGANNLAAIVQSGDDKGGEAVRNALSVGKSVLVRVDAVQHSPGESVISTLASPVACCTSYTRYLVSGSLSGEDRKALLPIVTAIETELDLRQKAVVDEKRGGDVVFFERVLYAYFSPKQRGANAADAAKCIKIDVDAKVAWWGPEEQGPPHRADATVVNLLTLVKAAELAKSDGSRSPATAPSRSSETNCEWSRPLRIHRSSPLAVFVAAGGDTKNQPLTANSSPALAQPARVVFSMFLMEMLNHLQAVRFCLNRFRTAAAVADHMAIWSAMRARQKEV